MLEYLRREDAWPSRLARRALFILVYRKILASSSFALSQTLDRLADSLEEKAAGVACQAQAELLLDMDGFAEEVEELFDEGSSAARPRGQLALRRMNDELSELRAYAKLARGIRVNAKGARPGPRASTAASPWPAPAAGPRRRWSSPSFERTQDYLLRACSSRRATRSPASRAA